MPLSGEPAKCLQANDYRTRVVRQDGFDLWPSVTNLSMKGCDLDCELPAGEIVSVELPDTTLFIGEVTASIASRSSIEFFRATSH